MPRVLDALIDFVFYQSCVLCSDQEGSLCADCLLKLPRAQGKCFACGKMNPFFVYCPACRKKYQPDIVLGLYKYSPKMRRIIRQMKFEDVSSLCYSFSDQITALLEKQISSPVLVPVPLSRKRKLYRGYNQSELIAKSLSKQRGWRVSNILRRNASELSQVEAKSKKSRKENIKGAFTIVGENVPDEVVLVDDVITSGATIEEATRVLKRAGVKKVVALALAMGR